MYFIGIDGSSSFTRLVGASDTGKTLAKHAGGSIRLRDNEPEIAKVTLAKLINEYNQLIGEKREACGGIAIGIDHGEDLEKYRELCRSINIDIPVYVGYHLELVMCSATRANSGLVLQAHNTSLGFCKNSDGEISYTGNFGRGIDDGGSSYWIGRRAIRSALMTLDGRRKNTILTQRLLEHFNVDEVIDLIQFTTNDKKHETVICDAAIIVKDCAEIEDASAIEIEDAAAYELHQIAHGLITKNDMRTGNIVAYGSVFANNPSILKKTGLIVNSIHQDVTLVHANEKPELGGVYLAQLLASSVDDFVESIPN